MQKTLPLACCTSSKSCSGRVFPLQCHVSTSCVSEWGCGCDGPTMLLELALSHRNMLVFISGRRRMGTIFNCLTLGARELWALTILLFYPAKWELKAGFVRQQQTQWITASFSVIVTGIRGLRKGWSVAAGLPSKRCWSKKQKLVLCFLANTSSQSGGEMTEKSSFS